MAEEKKAKSRSQVGMGSTYRKGSGQDLGNGNEIGAVMGGQVWMVKPDKKAKAANPCLWMQAGVVKFKNCDNYYDCTTCKYDNAMGQKAARGKQLTWQAAMRLRPDMDRVCRSDSGGARHDVDRERGRPSGNDAFPSQGSRESAATPGGRCGLVFGVAADSPLQRIPVRRRGGREGCDQRQTSIVAIQRSTQGQEHRRRSDMGSRRCRRFCEHHPRRQRLDEWHPRP